jgi:hypothetical protein
MRPTRARAKCQPFDSRPEPVDRVAWYRFAKPVMFRLPGGPGVLDVVALLSRQCASRARHICAARKITPTAAGGIVCDYRVEIVSQPLDGVRDVPVAERLEAHDGHDGCQGEDDQATRYADTA